MRRRVSLGVILAAALVVALAVSFVYLRAHAVAATPTACQTAQGKPGHGPLQTRPTGPQRIVQWNATPDPHVTPQGDSRTPGMANAPVVKPGTAVTPTPCPAP